jgi:hypothetical protein
MKVKDLPDGVIRILVALSIIAFIWMIVFIAAYGRGN